MADQLLTAIGVEVSAGRGRSPLRRPRPPAASSTAGWSTTADADQVAAVEAAGIACRAVPLMMTDLDATAAMAAAAVELVPMTRLGGLARPTACREVAAGDDLAALLLAAHDLADGDVVA